MWNDLDREKEIWRIWRCEKSEKIQMDFALQPGKKDGAYPSDWRMFDRLEPGVYTVRMEWKNKETGEGYVVSETFQFVEQQRSVL